MKFFSSEALLQDFFSETGFNGINMGYLCKQNFGLSCSKLKF